MMMEDAGIEKIGLYGGSFDPVHLGHLIVAQDAMEQLGLDRICFIPAAQAPLREDSPAASAEDRLAMLEAATAGTPGFEVIDDELRAGGVSYTIDTVRRLKARFDRHRLYWIIGGDQLDKLPKWKDIHQLAEFVEFICIHRPEHPLNPPEDVRGVARIHPLSVHPFSISSTEIRERCAARRPIRYFLPEAVSDYIARHQLYTAAEAVTNLPEQR